MEDRELEFWFFLSRVFGRTVMELKATMPYAEFVHHAANYRLNPYGDDWQQAGVMAWASVAPHSKKRFTPEDFTPKPKRKQESQSPEYIFGIFRQCAIDTEAQRNGRTKHWNTDDRPAD